MTTTSKTIKQTDISLSGVSKIILGVWYVVASIVYLMGASVEEGYLGLEYINKWLCTLVLDIMVVRQITVPSIILLYYHLIL